MVGDEVAQQLTKEDDGEVENEQTLGEEAQEPESAENE